MATKMDRKNRIARAAEIFRQFKITQEDIASMVGVSQPQISRILRGEGLRPTKISEEICLYAERIAGGGVTRQAVTENDDLMDALQATWNGSDSHAKALASVIRSLALLRR